MPPNQKFSKAVVLEAAFQLVQEQGIESLNARSIADKLGSSIQPVFGYYKNMADLKDDLFAMANTYHSSYFDKVDVSNNLFLQVGLAYVDFAIEEPNIFKLLFMSNGFDGKKLDAFMTDDDCNEHITNAIPSAFTQSMEASSRVFTDMWLYVHGIASMVVMNQLSFNKSEIETMIKNMCWLLTSEQLGGEK